MPISLPDLNTEEGIREYLVGNWYFDVKNVNDIVCEMNVGNCNSFLYRELSYSLDCQHFSRQKVKLIW